jgi:hypothetical protein
MMYLTAAVATMMITTATRRVASVPHRTFNNGPENPGTAVKSGCRQIDDAAKDSHQPRVNTAMRVRIGVIRMMSHRYSPLLTELSDRDGPAVPAGR